jgi:enoyl-[acyl-carrier-protein] reductase (NADH)
VEGSATRRIRLNGPLGCAIGAFAERSENIMATPSHLMRGKRGLIIGVANNRSIAWGIARACHGHGAELALTYREDALKKRVEPLAGESIDEVGGAPLYFLSDLSRGLTGKIHYVDAGYHIVGMKHPAAPDISVSKTGDA